MSGRPLADELLLGSGGLIWADFKRASGQPAVSGLVLALDAEVTSADRLGKAVVDLRAAVTIENPDSGWRRLGTATSKAPLHFPPSGTEYRRQPMTLELHVDSVALAATEVLRDGKDLRLRVELAGTAVTESGVGLAGSHGDSWTIPSQEWIARVLAQAQTHRHITVLAPVPDGDSQAEYRLADKQLEAAAAALREGRYGDAVMAVRKGVDVLGVRRQAAPQKSAHQRTVDERFGGLACALHDLTSAFAHLEGDNATYEWTRQDAVCVMAGLITLMQRSSGGP